MRGRWLAVFVMAAVVVAVGCSREEVEREEEAPVVAETVSAEFALEGMSCEGCVAAIGGALKATAGVVSQRVELAETRAYVTFDPTRTGPADLIAAIEGAGYRAALVPPGAQVAFEPTAM